MDERQIIPKDGVNPYAHHPGFSASGCELRMTVTNTDAYGSGVSGGFACRYSGGHCRPGEHCAKWRADY